MTTSTLNLSRTDIEGSIAFRSCCAAIHPDSPTEVVQILWNTIISHYFPGVHAFKWLLRGAVRDDNKRPYASVFKITHATQSTTRDPRFNERLILVVECKRSQPETEDAWNSAFTQLDGYLSANANGSTQIFGIVAIGKKARISRWIENEASVAARTARGNPHAIQRSQDRPIERPEPPRPGAQAGLQSSFYASQQLGLQSSTLGLQQAGQGENRGGAQSANASPQQAVPNAQQYGVTATAEPVVGGGAPGGASISLQRTAPYSPQYGGAAPAQLAVRGGVPGEAQLGNASGMNPGLMQDGAQGAAPGEIQVPAQEEAQAAGRGTDLTWAHPYYDDEGPIEVDLDNTSDLQVFEYWMKFTKKWGLLVSGGDSG
jgi:hypothetical protein